MRNKHFPEYPRVKRPPEQKKGRFQSFEKVYRCTPFSDTNLFFFSGIFWDILAYFFLSKWPFSEAFCRRQWIRTLRTDEIPRQPCIDIIDVLSQSSTITCQYKGYIEGNPRCRLLNGIIAYNCQHWMWHSFFAQECQQHCWQHVMAAPNFYQLWCCIATLPMFRSWNTLEWDFLNLECPQAIGFPIQKWHILDDSWVPSKKKPPLKKISQTYTHYPILTPIDIRYPINIQYVDIIFSL